MTAPLTPLREPVPHNVTINTVCPGLFDTDARHTSLHGHAKRGNLIARICSALAGFMAGQNIVNAGGACQGLF